MYIYIYIYIYITCLTSYTNHSCTLYIHICIYIYTNIHIYIRCLTCNVPDTLHKSFIYIFQIRIDFSNTYTFLIYATHRQEQQRQPPKTLYMWHVSLKYVTCLIHVHVTSLIRIYFLYIFVTHRQEQQRQPPQTLYMWHDSFKYVTCLIHIHVTSLIHIYFLYPYDKSDNDNRPRHLTCDTTHSCTFCMCA